MSWDPGAIVQQLILDTTDFATKITNVADQLVATAKKASIVVEAKGHQEVEKQLDLLRAKVSTIATTNKISIDFNTKDSEKLVDKLYDKLKKLKDEAQQTASTIATASSSRQTPPSRPVVPSGSVLTSVPPYDLIDAYQNKRRAQKKAMYPVDWSSAVVTPHQYAQNIPDKRIQGYIDQWSEVGKVTTNLGSMGKMGKGSIQELQNYLSSASEATNKHIKKLLEYSVSTTHVKAAVDNLNSSLKSQISLHEKSELASQKGIDDAAIKRYTRELSALEKVEQDAARGAEYVNRAINNKGLGVEERVLQTTRHEYQQLLNDQKLRVDMMAREAAAATAVTRGISLTAHELKLLTKVEQDAARNARAFKLAPGQAEINALRTTRLEYDKLVHSQLQMIQSKFDPQKLLGSPGYINNVAAGLKNLAQGSTGILLRQPSLWENIKTKVSSVTSSIHGMTSAIGKTNTGLAGTNQHVNRLNQGFLRSLWASMQVAIKFSIAYRALNLIYQGVWGIVGALKKALEVQDNFMLTTATVAAMLTSASKSKLPIWEINKGALIYAEAAIPLLDQLAAKTALTNEQLYLVWQTFIRLKIPPGTVADFEKMANIANAIKALTFGQPFEKQATTELEALTTGRKQGAQLLRNLRSVDANFDATYKRLVSIGQVTGDFSQVFTYLDTLLKGFGANVDRIKNSWTGVYTTGIGIYNIISRLAMSDILPKLVANLNEFYDKIWYNPDNDKKYQAQLLAQTKAAKASTKKAINVTITPTIEKPKPIAFTPFITTPTIIKPFEIPKALQPAIDAVPSAHLTDVGIQAAEQLRDVWLGIVTLVKLYGALVTEETGAGTRLIAGFVRVFIWANAFILTAIIHFRGGLILVYNLVKSIIVGISDLLNIGLGKLATFVGGALKWLGKNSWGSWFESWGRSFRRDAAEGSEIIDRALWDIGDSVEDADKLITGLACVIADFESQIKKKITVPEASDINKALKEGLGIVGKLGATPDVKKGITDAQRQVNKEYGDLLAKQRSYLIERDVNTRLYQFIVDSEGRITLQDLQQKEEALKKEEALEHKPQVVPKKGIGKAQVDELEANVKKLAKQSTEAKRLRDEIEGVFKIDLDLGDTIAAQDQLLSVMDKFPNMTKEVATGYVNVGKEARKFTNSQSLINESLDIYLGLAERKLFIDQKLEARDTVTKLEIQLRAEQLLVEAYEKGIVRSEEEANRLKTLIDLRLQYAGLPANSPELGNLVDVTAALAEAETKRQQFFQAQGQSIDAWLDKLINEKRQFVNFLEDITSSFEKSFGDKIFDMLEGTKVKFKDFFKDLKSIINRGMADLIASQMKSSLAKVMKDVFGARDTAEETGKYIKNIDTSAPIDYGKGQGGGPQEEKQQFTLGVGDAFKDVTKGFSTTYDKNQKATPQQTVLDTQQTVLDTSALKAFTVNIDSIFKDFIFNISNIFKDFIINIGAIFKDFINSLALSNKTSKEGPRSNEIKLDSIKNLKGSSDTPFTLDTSQSFNEYTDGIFGNTFDSNQGGSALEGDSFGLNLDKSFSDLSDLFLDSSSNSTKELTKVSNIQLDAAEMTMDAANVSEGASNIQAASALKQTGYLSKITKFFSGLFGGSGGGDGGGSAGITGAGAGGPGASLSAGITNLAGVAKTIGAGALGIYAGASIGKSVGKMIAPGVKGAGTVGAIAGGALTVALSTTAASAVGAAVGAGMGVAMGAGVTAGAAAGAAGAAGGMAAAGGALTTIAATTAWIPVVGWIIAAGAALAMLGMWIASMIGPDPWKTSAHERGNWGKTLVPALTTTFTRFGVDIASTAMAGTVRQPELADVPKTITIANKTFTFEFKHAKWHSAYTDESMEKFKTWLKEQQERIEAIVKELAQSIGEIISKSFTEVDASAGWTQFKTNTFADFGGLITSAITGAFAASSTFLKVAMPLRLGIEAAIESAVDTSGLFSASVFESVISPQINAFKTGFDNLRSYYDELYRLNQTLTEGMTASGPSNYLNLAVSIHGEGDQRQVAAELADTFLKELDRRGVRVVQ